MTKALFSRVGVLSVALMLSLTMLTACDGESPFGQGNQGTLRVLVAGHDINGGNAGQLRYTSEDFDLIVPIPVSGMLEQSAPAGTYDVIYTPPSGYSLADGQTATRTITITAGELTEVVFLVEEGGAPPPPPPPQNGTVHLTVSGLAQGATSGGTAQLTRTDISGQTPTSVLIPGSGSADVQVPAGTYNVSYNAPTGYQLASGQTNPRSITVAAGGTTNTTFQVQASGGGEPQQGTARVQVSGLTSGASSGGSAQLTRTDATGQAPTSLVIPGSGSAQAQVPAGTYSVTYTAPSGYQLASGQTNPRSITVTANNTTTTTFQVQTTGGGGGGGGTPGVLFFSDWRNQLGNSESALSDGGKWNVLSSGASSNASIIDAPAGFSTHKVIRVRSETGHRDGWMEPRRTGLGEIPVGSTRNFRWEIAFHEPALSDAGQHPIQDGGAVSISNWYLGTTNGGSNLQSGQWGIDFVFGGTDWDNSKFTLGSREGQYTPLQKGVVYRMEVQLARFSSSQFRFYVWIYDAAGNLLYDCDDFRVRNGSRSLCNFAHTVRSTSSMDAFLIGLNGIGNSPSWPIHSSDQAAFAVVQGLPEGQQIGPYGNVQGEVRR